MIAPPEYRWDRHRHRKYKRSYRSPVEPETKELQVSLNEPQGYLDKANHVDKGRVRTIFVGVTEVATLLQPKHFISSDTNFTSTEPAFIVYPKSQEETLAQAEVIKHVLSVLGIDPERCQYKNMGILKPKLPPARMAEHVCEKEPHPNDPNQAQIKIIPLHGPWR